MKRIPTMGVLAGLLAGWAAAADGTGIKLPTYQRHVLDNGLVLLLAEQRELPLVSVEMILRSGAAVDPAGKEGVVDLTTNLLRRGTTTRTADRLAEELDFMGARLRFSANADYVSGSAEFLTKDAAAGLAILADILRNASFPQDEFQKQVDQAAGAIKSAKDQPQAVINRYFNSFLFGRHPYHRPVGGDENSLRNIKRQDILDFYRVHFAPNNLIVSIVGDFDMAEMRSAFEKNFGDWQRKTVPTATIASPLPVKGKKLLLVDKPDATQTFFVFGNIGIRRKNPDWVTIYLVNTLLGGRFTSMLNTELRIRSGLTYGAHSGFYETVVPGAFTISTYTPTKTTAEAIDLALEVLKKLHTEGISEQQLQSAKNYLKGQLPPTMETSDQLAGVLAEHEFFGLDDDEVNQLYPRIDKVTVQDARRIIERYFPSEDFVFTVIGNAGAIRDKLAKYASTIETKSISDAGF